MSVSNGTNENEDRDEEIIYPGITHVLCGRGGHATCHAGNVKFRQFIEDHKLQYTSASRAQKSVLADRVVQLWRHQQPPGKFLARIDASRGDDSPWREVGDRQARLKVAQALREKTEPYYPDQQSAVPGTAATATASLPTNHPVRKSRKRERAQDTNPSNLVDLVPHSDSSAQTVSEEMNGNAPAAKKMHALVITPALPTPTVPVTALPTPTVATTAATAAATASIMMTNMKMMLGLLLLQQQQQEQENIPASGLPSPVGEKEPGPRPSPASRPSFKEEYDQWLLETGLAATPTSNGDAGAGQDPTATLVSDASSISSSDNSWTRSE